MGTPVRPEEVEMIMSMDDAYLSEVQKEQADAAARAEEAASMKRGR